MHDKPARCSAGAAALSKAAIKGKRGEKQQRPAGWCLYCRNYFETSLKQTINTLRAMCHMQDKPARRSAGAAALSKAAIKEKGGGQAARAGRMVPSLSKLFSNFIETNFQHFGSDVPHAGQTCQTLCWSCNTEQGSYQGGGGQEARAGRMVPSLSNLIFQLH
jgi:hypothetical protein